MCEAAHEAHLPQARHPSMGLLHPLRSCHATHQLGSQDGQQELALQILKLSAEGTLLRLIDVGMLVVLKDWLKASSEGGPARIDRVAQILEVRALRRKG